MNQSHKNYLLVVAALAVLIGIWQVPFILRGDYSREPVWRIASPNGRYRIEVSRQATFPALDILDPWGTAYFVVVDTTNGEAVARANMPLAELFDLKRPAVDWTTAQVQVRDFAAGNAAAVVQLSLPR